MCGFFVFLFYGFCQLRLTIAQPEAYAFSNNYTYRIFHTYNYEYKQPPSFPSPTFPKEVELQNSSPLLPQFAEPLPLQNGINQSRKSRQDNLGLTSSRMGQETTDQRRVLTVNGTNCAYGFCEQAENYPEQIILKLVEGNKAISAFFRPKVPDIGERLNVDFENLCEVTKSSVVPKTAQNTAGKNRIVVNLKNYQQIVESEVCRGTAQCKFQKYWPRGYEGKCIQKFVEVPLAVMDEQDNEIIIDKFSYPSGCYCACKSD